MTQISSRTAPVFDKSGAGFRGSARDLGEVLAYLAGGVRPEGASLARLHLSLRGLQGFLLQEAEDQAYREVIARAVSVPFDGDGSPQFGVS
ncbi:hypothetical protein [Fuscovulum blasticum]|uniref:hypothetical protein n=1 Tax=Fuscovulum blasticum TaxID=1075 RepID=UPI000D3E0FE0|nr:hypothetical protein [Fuscovulum blasticum]AWD21580.1 hypothetical protein B6K69_07755 [Fuscovulum blasticum]